MKLIKNILKWFFIVVGLIFGAAVMQIILSPEETVQDAEVEVLETAEETAEEKQARWNRGEFTEDEVADLEAEQMKEDQALERFGDQIDAGAKPEDIDLENVWEE